MSARTTWTLLGAVAVAAGIDVAVRLGTTSTEALPGVEPVSELDGLVVQQGDGAVRLERRDDRWWVTEPYDFPADPAAVAQVLGPWRDGVVPDARVGTGELDRYGLAGGEAIRVEAWSGASEVGAFYVGHDSEAGSTWIRLADSDAVYLARLGGRGRFDRETRAWRDRTIWSVDPGKIERIAIDDLAIGRTTEGWRVDDEPDFPLDPALLDAVIGAVARFGGSEVRSEVSDPERSGELSVRLEDGAELVATVGVSGDQGFATVDGRDGVYLLPGRLAHRLLAGREGWRDQTLWTLDPASIRALEWTGSESVRLVRDERTGQWVGPAGVDPRHVQAAAGFLARMRVEAFVDRAPAQVGLPGTAGIVIVADRAITLQFGDRIAGGLDGRDAVAVRSTEDLGRIGLIEADVYDRLATAFGR